MALRGITWTALAAEWSWGALAAHGWDELIPFPTYRVRAGFVAAGWGEVASNYGWTTLAGAFTWAELAAGPVAADDIRSVRIERSVADVFRRLEAGQIDLVLDNARGEYSPENTGGPNSLKVQDVIAVKAVTEAGSVFGLFSGFVEQYAVSPELERRTAHVRGSDRARLLKRAVNLGLKADTRVASLFADVLSAAGIAAAEREVDTLADQVTFAFLDEMSAGEAFDRLLRSGAHLAYVSGAGKVTVKERNRDLLQTAAATYEDFALVDFALSGESLVNDARIAGQPRGATSVSTVAWLDETQTIAAGADISFALGFLDPVNGERNTPVNSLATPVAGSDYVLNAAPDGGGADLTSGANVAVDAFATSALVTVTNANAGPGYLTRFQLRGVPLRRKPAFVARTENASSQALYDRRSLTIESDLVTDVLKAADYAAYLVAEWAEPAGEIRIALKNRFPDLLERELLDRITLVESNTAVSSDYVIESVEHTITFGRGQEHVSEFGVRRARDKLYLVLGDAAAGRLDADRTLGF